MDAISGIAGVVFLIVVVVLIKSKFVKKEPQQKKIVTTSERLESLTPLLTRNEALCRSNPNLYLLQIFAVALLGYAYIWCVLAISVVGTILGLLLLLKFPILALKFGLVMVLGLGALIWTVLKSFWVKFDPPAGIRLTKDAYPKLFELIEEVRSKIRGPKIHEVVLDSQMNAAVYQIPRFGFFGWNKNYLLLGLPLMQGSSEDQFRSIIGHEMGHLAEKHGGPYAWVYSTHMVWNNLLDSIEKNANQGYASAFFMRFFNWYGPIFAAFTFPARREKEYGADQCAIDLVGKDLTAQALISVGVKISYLSTKYWDELIATSKHMADAPRSAYAGISQAFANDIKFEDAETWLRQSLKEKTSFADTHPCKTDRLARVLNIPKEEVAEYANKVLKDSLVIQKTAAEAYLGEHLPIVTSLLDSEWHHEIEEIWKISHTQYQEWKKELEDLELKAESSELSPEELALLAVRTASLHDEDTAMPIFEKAIEAAPDDPNVHDAFARCLFNKNDQRCVVHFERAMKLDRMMEYECAQLIRAFYLKNDNPEKAIEYERIYTKFVFEYAKMQTERADLLPTDKLAPHGLDEAGLKKIIDQLDQYPKLKSLHMFQKVVKYFPESPCYVLVVDSLRDSKIGDLELQTQLVNAMAQSLTLPGATLLRSRIGMPKNIKSAIKNNPDSKIFSRQ